MWVVRQGWHTEIALPTEEITGPLVVFRDVFPDARVLVFGFGKRTFITAKVETPAELLMGPLPGPSAVQVTALSVDPERAYDGPVTELTLPPGGAARLSAYLWNAIGKTKAGELRLIAEGLFPGSLFYAGSRRYDLGVHLQHVHGGRRRSGGISRVAAWRSLAGRGDAGGRGDRPGVPDARNGRLMSKAKSAAGRCRAVAADDALS